LYFAIVLYPFNYQLSFYSFRLSFFSFHLSFFRKSPQSYKIILTYAKKIVILLHMSKKSSTFARFFRRWAPCAREKTFVENAFATKKG